jgi:short-subunit dehydrogenase
MKTLLITGASSGIGRALALRAGRAGYAVYAVGRNRDALGALAAAIESDGGIVAIDAVDISKPENAPGLIARALARFGTLDVLVNNAGFVSAGPIVAQSDAELQLQFGTHVLGPLALVRAALDALRASHGHVFMLGSGVARVAVGSLGAYPPAKAAIRSATTILGRELRPQGIAVTYVDPGAVDTPFMTRAGMPGAPATLLVSPEVVARKILNAIKRRPRVLNAVPWQTTLVALAQTFPGPVEFLLERNPALVGGGELQAASPVGVPAIEVQPEIAAQPAAPEHESYGSALEPHRRRMEKLKLSDAFVRGLLVPGAILERSAVAMQWAGMPNKNERAVTDEVLDALAQAKYLEALDDQTFRVLRAPESTST